MCDAEEMYPLEDIPGGGERQRMIVFRRIFSEVLQRLSPPPLIRSNLTYTTSADLSSDQIVGVGAPRASTRIEHAEICG